MSRMRKIVTLSMIVLIISVGLYNTGCEKSGDQQVKSGTAVAANVELCMKCGQIKGSEDCCKPDQPKCVGCGLAKGSPGCCNIPKDAETAAICTKCGQIKGTDACCQPDKSECSKCGLDKGSPGCCKLPK